MRNTANSKKILTIFCVTLGVVGVIACNCGHAALSTELLISGEAKVSARNDFGVEYMQEMTPEICNSVAELSTAQLQDQRDDKKYWVTKLPDGQCWMTQNLDYDGGGTKFTARNNFNNWIGDESTTPRQYYYSNDNAEGLDSDGSYYSYFASTSVCPAGWHLPTGFEYQTLFSGADFKGTTTQKVATAMDAPYNFRLSGWVRNGDGLVGVGQYANYAEARTLGDSASYVAVLASNQFDSMGENDGFFFGSSVRCAVGEPEPEPQDLMTINNMQDLTLELCHNTSLWTTRRLIDTRDQHKYWVTKLQDGNCWMVQNLDYQGGGKRYTDTTLANWVITGQPTQYYYRGDWQNGRDSLGSLYSWKSALAVCPTGWRLPTGGMDGEFDLLWSEIGAGGAAHINALRADPYYFVAAGYVTNTNTVQLVNTEGYWWTSEGVGGDTAYAAFYHRPASVTNYSEEGTYFGESVRCLVSGE